MGAESLLASHVVLGLLGTLAAAWVLVELLTGSGRTRRRVCMASLTAAAFIWMSCLTGGHWYESFYPADKALILAGPRPWAHSILMEAKEHLFFALLLLSTYLPTIVHRKELLVSRSIRTLALVVAGLVVLLGLSMAPLGVMIRMAAGTGSG